MFMINLNNNEKIMHSQSDYERRYQYAAECVKYLNEGDIINLTAKKCVR